MLKSTKRLLEDILRSMPEVIAILADMPDNIDSIWEGHPDELLNLNVFDRMDLHPVRCHYYKNKIEFYVMYGNLRSGSVFSSKALCQFKGNGHSIFMHKKDLKRLVEFVKDKNFNLLMNFI